MEFNPDYIKNVPYIYGVFPQNRCMKPEIRTMVSFPPLNDANHHFVLAAIDHSSTGPFLVIPSPASKPTHTNESAEGFVNNFDSMDFITNNNKMEIVHGYLNTDKGFWNFYQNNSLQSGKPTEPQIQEMMFKLQEHLYSFDRTENNPFDADQRFVLVDKNQQKSDQVKNDEILTKVTHTIKGKWTADDDRYKNHSKSCILSHNDFMIFCISF